MKIVSTEIMIERVQNGPSYFDRPVFIFELENGFYFTKDERGSLRSVENIEAIRKNSKKFFDEKKK